MKQTFLESWQKLTLSEKRTVVIGGFTISIILFYWLIWQPWHVALERMEILLPSKRQDLVWMQQQAVLIKGDPSKLGGAKILGTKQSLLSVVEQTAKKYNLNKSIQQLSPSQIEQEVRVVLSGADFNQWLAWVDLLNKQYGVRIKELSAQRDNKKKNRAEVRVTFVR